MWSTGFKGLSPDRLLEIGQYSGLATSTYVHRHQFAARSVLGLTVSGQMYLFTKLIYRMKPFSQHYHPQIIDYINTKVGTDSQIIRRRLCAERWFMGYLLSRKYFFYYQMSRNF